MEQPVPSGAEDLLRTVWPEADAGHLHAEKISHRRNADHWRVQFDEDSLILRSTTRQESAQRIIAALTALRDEPFAPVLRAWTRGDDGAFLIAMEDLGDSAPAPSLVQSMLPEFVAIIKRVHNLTAFGDAVIAVGRRDSADASLAWAEGEWAMLNEIAPDDDRLAPAVEWMAIARAHARRADEARSIMVSGHGDLHNANWRRSPRGLALIDWEEIRRWPLASELADFVVFGDLEPAEVTRLYGASPSYGECVRREAATCALSFYLYWLRTMLDGTDPRTASFAQVRIACERLFSGKARSF